MKLHGSFTSPFVRHCRIALLQQGMDFEFIETDYAQSAEGSPAMRVPYLQDGDLVLHDSSSILKHIRQRNDQGFCQSTEEFDLYLLVTTALDSTINLFLLEKSGVDIATNNYTQRQAQRIQQCLQALNSKAGQGLEWNDAGIRLACFIDWALFRQRLDLSGFPALLNWLDDARQSREFDLTTPPAG